MKFLITGACGFIGSNLAAALLSKQRDVTLLDNLSRLGSDQNLKWLQSMGDVEFFHIDTADAASIDKVVKETKPAVVFHLAGQVAMTVSVEDPHKDFQTNVIGGHNILESVRRYCPDATVIYSSTNKVYGDLEHVAYREDATRYVALGYDRGFDESTPLDFRTPYGCSKGATDQYMLDYARTFGLATVVFRHSSVFGIRQFSTYDQGWIGWFVSQALALAQEPTRQPFTISGNGKQVRDVLFIEDLVNLYLQAAESKDKIRGEVFNIGGGPENSLSLLELFKLLEQQIGVRLTYEKLPWRKSDQKVFVANIGKVSRMLGWAPQINRDDGIRRMIEWVKHNA